MSSMATQARPRPPSVDRILSAVRTLDAGELSELVDTMDGAALTALVRGVVEEERERLATGAQATPDAGLAEIVAERIGDLHDPAQTVPPHVINATGVVLHTNLGRAPWPARARAAAVLAARSYGYLELDEDTGRRGARFRAAEEHLVALTGAEAAMVVTNNAAGLLLAVGLAGQGGSVVVSRGELVEIGGGVRIPEIVARAGARLVEVGTTNRTRAADFEAPLANGSAQAVLRVHPSNFELRGFVESADLPEVAAIAHRHGAIVVDDLGSGALIDTAGFGLAHEPTPNERLAQGADLVLFSGDKLVGGPQAGLVVGRAELVERLRRDPLARAVRPDKAILAGVAATLAIYRAGTAVTDIPIWRTIATDADSLHERAERIRSTAAATTGRTDVDVVPVEAPVGGGSLPGQVLPSWGVAVPSTSPTRDAARLRGEPDRILARIADDAIVFDLRTVRPFEDAIVARRIAELSRTP
jgi:L-seryl-tRNA(Ser) seleniumtransferase